MIDVSFMTKNFGKYNINSLKSYVEIGGMSALKKAIKMEGEDLAALLTAAQIKGRGGAAYPMGKKWSQARAVRAQNKVVVCNADEGEPCTFKDRTLIQNDPFNLLEGIIIAGYAVGAQNAYIYLREEYSHLRPLIQNAINQLKEYGYLGENILESNFGYEIHLCTGAGAYVCGEGTALVESIEGKSGRPRMKPPYIKQCGLYNYPTCVQNVESLSLVASIINDDQKIYQTYGTKGEKGSMGTKMVSVAGNVKCPGVFEIPFGVTVRQIIYDLAGGVVDNRGIKLIQFGGASGKVSSSEILDTQYSYEHLTKAGVGVGSGAILVVDDRTSVIDFLIMTQEFFSHESCGQCAPCREGNRQIRFLLQKIKEGKHTEADLAKLKNIADIMTKTSLCGLGQAAQNALQTALKVFGDEFKVVVSD